MTLFVFLHWAGVIAAVLGQSALATQKRQSVYHRRKDESAVAIQLDLKLDPCG